MNRTDKLIWAAFCVVFGSLLALSVYGLVTEEARRDAWAVECAAQPGATPELCRFLQRYITP